MARFRVPQGALKKRLEYPLPRDCSPSAQKNSLLPTPKSQCQLDLEGGLCQGWRITGPSVGPVPGNSQ